MSNSIVSNVYRFVIDDVVTNITKDFEDSGVDLSVLQDLQRLWELKVASSRVANFEPVSYNDSNNSQLLNNEEYNPYYAESAGSLFAPTTGYNAMVDGHPTYVEGANVAAANLASLASASSSLLGNGSDLLNQNLYEYNPSSTSAPASESVTVKTDNVPQVDGANDCVYVNESDKILHRKIIENHKAQEESKVEQLDGNDDDLEDDEDAINSALDDSDGAENDDDGNEETEHIILCQYDKVSRTKNKWKCVLKDGIISVNGRDYLFNKASGDFEW
ncbi:transcription factor IIA, alpha/beta subunit [Conidiobolus coronatus NRRL 28638]|uniref:Transcription initiation factor IIA large subunit n=1 Tax=Conidiobolus coronatus (strain ATCC 28846 / CBS 209.66 / NRRL 28638) TaxID=796925 RepID=A0A137P4X3_CONC2|nr:transcription factor IIA, alpha/beta subunit [Conidiobolus coronatus NRRL 28638]|eukprot:KXN70055.1 transcription factor IIA, alpha/beta subunit [Conidiobolus coronatus NRRL 28638]